MPSPAAGQAEIAGSSVDDRATEAAAGAQEESAIQIAAQSPAQLDGRLSAVDSADRFNESRHAPTGAASNFLSDPPVTRPTVPDIGDTLFTAPPRI